MTEAEQGIKITEAGITMKEYIPIAFGWSLGIASSLLMYWFGRFRKRRDFKNGLKSELIENLPRMVLSAFGLRIKLGTVDREHLIWCRDSLIKYYSPEEIVEQFPELYKLLNQAPDTLKTASYLFKEFQAGTGTELKKFKLVFLENHLDRILLLDTDSQKRIYKIQYRIDVVNQTIDRYFFYFDKTFEPKIVEVNQKALNENMDGSYKFLSKILLLVTNDFTELLEKL